MMDNRTEAISSAAIHYQMVNKRLGSKLAEKKKTQTKVAGDSISDCLETSDSDTQGETAKPPGNSEAHAKQRPDVEGIQSGSILDISG